MSLLHPAWARRLRAGFSAASRGSSRCPVCGSRVGHEDAIGLVDDRLAHAECALYRWRGHAALIAAGGLASPAGVSGEHGVRM